MNSIEERIFVSQIWETIHDGNILEWNQLDVQLRENEYLITLPQIFKALKSKTLPLHMRRWFEKMKKTMMEEERLSLKLGVKPGIKSYLERRGTKKQRRKWDYKDKFPRQRLSANERAEREFQQRRKEMKKPMTFVLHTHKEVFVEPLIIPRIKNEEVEPKKREIQFEGLKSDVLQSLDKFDLSHEDSMIDHNFKL